MMFLSMGCGTFFVIKCSTLIISLGYGSSSDGSILIMIISAGSLISGAMYGKIYSKIKQMSLVLFYIVTALSFIIAGLFDNMLMMLVASFLLGFGLMAFVPYLQEQAHILFGHFGELATSMILVSQSLGAFLAPYFGTIFDIFTSNLSMQFIIVGGIYCALSVISLLMYMVQKT